MIPDDGASKRNWAAMSDESLGVVPSKSESHEFQYLKRSKTSSPTRYSNFTINIDDLPDPLLFEIILRLPAKSAARYKCVSRRWFALISHHTFLSRFLCLRRDKRKPLPMKPTLIFLDAKRFSATSELPIFKTGSFSFDFLPCTRTGYYKNVDLDNPPTITSCNDLVLWCAGRLQRDYYICNPYTKQWTAIPPTPRCNFEVRVGFICEPYYYYKEDVDDHQSEIDSNNTIQLNVDYKYAIVRILSPMLGSGDHFSELNVEIFSSETGKWIESIVSCPPCLRFKSLRFKSPGVAYKGKLYWVHDCCPNFMIALDPFSNNNYFDVVGLPGNEWGRISVSQDGRFRFCMVSLDGDRGDIEPLSKGLRIWELKDDDKVDGRVGKWCKIDTLPLDKMVSENPSIMKWSRSSEIAYVLAFDPSNDDILYVESIVDKNDMVIMCNIRANTLKEVTSIKDRYRNLDYEPVFRFMVPWWPTPVPKIEYNYKDTHAAHLNNCDLCQFCPARYFERA